MANQYNVNGLLNLDNKEAEDEAAKQAAAAAAVIEMLTAKLQAELPVPVFEKAARKAVTITLSDGIKLESVAYMPEGEGAWPVILHRFPYGPSEFPEHDIVAEMFAKRGYVYFTNRCRGTGISGGRINAFEQETKDGLEVLDFVSEQEWCDGNIGTYGASYMGHVQWSVAGTKNPALKTMYIQVFGGHPYATYYRNGMILQDIWQSWAMGNGGNARDRSPEEEAALHQKAFDIKPPIKMGERLLGDPVEWAQKWFLNPEECNDGWQKGFWKEYEDNVKKLKLPILLQCGWFDLFCQSQLDSWRALPKETRKKSLCLVGPWDHFGFTNGVLPYPEQDRYGVMQIKTTMMWFDHFLKGAPLELPIGGIETYSIGDDVWKFWEDDISASDTAEFYFDQSTLQADIPEGGQASYTYDPENPVKSLALGLSKGVTIAPAPGEREPEGVYSFVSEPLSADVYLAGRMRTELYVSSTAPATAFTVALFEIREDGKSYLIFNDITDIRYEKDHFESYEPNSIKKITWDSPDIVWTFKSGRRIRIDVSSSDFPWYNAHNNTTVRWGEATVSYVARNTVYYGGKTPSRIILPVNAGRCKE